VEEKGPYVEGDSIGDSYFKALELLVKKNPYRHLTVSILQPFFDTSMQESPKSRNIDDWCKILNVGNIHERFCEFEFFSEKCKTKMGESTGKAWINDRIEALLEPGGEYYGRLEKQLEIVEKRLQAKMPGGCTNALVCQVFLPHDLEKACVLPPRPRAPNLPCLIMLDFKPKIINRVSRLSLFAVYRSQFFDTKAYGNFVSLAILLYRMCQKTECKPGLIVSTANNATFCDERQKRPLYDFLKNGKMTGLGK